MIFSFLNVFSWQKSPTVLLWLSTILAQFTELKTSVYFIYGAHCFYNPIYFNRLMNCKVLKNIVRVCVIMILLLKITLAIVTTATAALAWRGHLTARYKCLPCVVCIFYSTQLKPEMKTDIGHMTVSILVTESHFPTKFLHY